MQIHFKQFKPQTLRLSTICGMVDSRGNIWDAFVDEHDKLFLICSNFAFDPLNAIAYFHETEFKVKYFCNVEITVL
jgi:hypothetical protein